MFPLPNMAVQRADGSRDTLRGRVHDISVEGVPLRVHFLGDEGDFSGDEVCECDAAEADGLDLAVGGEEVF